jgi:hypothetical protein
MSPLKCFSYIKTTTILDTYFKDKSKWPLALT